MSVRASMWMRASTRMRASMRMRVANLRVSASRSSSVKQIRQSAHCRASCKLAHSVACSLLFNVGVVDPSNWRKTCWHGNEGHLASHNTLLDMDSRSNACSSLSRFTYCMCRLVCVIVFEHVCMRVFVRACVCVFESTYLHVCSPIATVSA